MAVSKQALAPTRNVTRRSWPCVRVGQENNILLSSKAPIGNAMALSCFACRHSFTVASAQQNPGGQSAQCVSGDSVPR